MTLATPAVAPPPVPAVASLPVARRPSGTTADFLVDTMQGPLRVRSAPRISQPAGRNVVADPDGHPVRALDTLTVGDFREIETSLDGAYIRGFVASRYLTPAAPATPIPVIDPVVAPRSGGVPAALLPHPAGTVARRSQPAGAYALNEAGQPVRAGATAAELTAALGRIIDWLAVDDPAHRRYQPRGSLTFCNIYAHDYCHLAGAYLPRVWWTPGALRDLLRGGAVRPVHGTTVEEVRANGLFRWLRDFGPDFGWRRATTATELQDAANSGGLGVIVARRPVDGPPGHIAMVIPETGGHTAQRTAGGEVRLPLQSQAGRTNFRRGTGTGAWWRGAQFADSAFWVHA